MRVRSFLCAALVLVMHVSSAVAFASTTNLFSTVRPCGSAPAIPGAVTYRLDPVQAAQLRAGAAELKTNLLLDGPQLSVVHFVRNTDLPSRFVFHAVTDTGIVVLAPPEIEVYDGYVEGDTASHARMTIDASGMMGAVWTHGHSYAIVPVNSVTHGGDLVTVYADANRLLPAGALSCATPDHDPVWPSMPAPEPELFQSPGNAAPAPAAAYLAHIAIQTDYELLTDLGTVGAVKTYVMQLMAQVTAIYESEINTQIDTVGVYIQQTPSEPYTATDLPGALSEFTNYWNSNMGSVSRACAALLSKKGCGAVGLAGCGYADLDALCIPSRAYSANQICGNVMVIDRFIVAHEIGHNFGARHTHSCWWVDSGYVTSPIDECAQVEDGTCFSGTTQSNGTLMSYCNQKDYSFGTVVGPWVKMHTADLARSGRSCFGATKSITAIDTVIAFGPVKPGATKDSTMAAFLVNTGSQSITVSAMKFSGPDAGRFSIVSGGPSFTLAAGAKRSVKLRFSCDSMIDREAYLTITSTATNSPMVIHLIGFAQGAGVAPVAAGAPAELALEQNYPNPVDAASAQAQTMITFALPGAGTAIVTVCDMYGRTIATPVNERLDAGRYRTVLDARAFAAGTYMVRLQSGSRSLTRTLQVVR